MTTMVSLRRGHDVRYFTNHGGVGGCAGAMAYYTKGGNRRASGPGRARPSWAWPGRWTRRLSTGCSWTTSGRAGRSWPAATRPRATRPPRNAPSARSARSTLTRRRGARRVPRRAAGRAAPRAVPYFDLTISAVKSVSVLHASYRVAAMQARRAGRTDRADALDATSRRDRACD